MSSPTSSSKTRGNSIGYAASFLASMRLPANLEQTHLFDKELLKEKQSAQSLATGWEMLDTIMLWLATLIQDDAVMEAEYSVFSSQSRIRNEILMLQRLSSFVPSYHGIIASPNEVLSGTLSHDAYLVLQDLTTQFTKPCVLDLKMGGHSYEPDASFLKKEKEISKYPEQDTFGFRFVGMRVYDPSHPESVDSEYRLFDKYYGYSLKTEEQLQDSFRLFFTDPSTGLVRVDVVQVLLNQLQTIQSWFEQNQSLCFYSSSLLLSYEGRPSSNNPESPILRMIDFGHVRRELGGDHGYVHGIKTVKRHLSRLLCQE